MYAPIKFYFIIVTVFFLSNCSQDSLSLTPENLRLVDRDFDAAMKSNASEVHLNGKAGVGMAILKTVNFQEGTIEIDLRGEDRPGSSFVGMAFNIQNDSTYEAIYFRPFNFKATEKIRREHSVQYISEPKHSWRFLRENHEGVYESEFTNPPSGDDWFSVRIIIKNDKVVVEERLSHKALLTVDRIKNGSSPSIGLWVGHNSSGSFRNLRISE